MNTTIEVLDALQDAYRQGEIRLRMHCPVEILTQLSRKGVLDFIYLPDEDASVVWLTERGVDGVYGGPVERQVAVAFALPGVLNYYDQQPAALVSDEPARVWLDEWTDSNREPLWPEGKRTFQQVIMDWCDEFPGLSYLAIGVLAALFVALLALLVFML